MLYSIPTWSFHSVSISGLNAYNLGFVGKKGTGKGELGS